MHPSPAEVARTLAAGRLPGSATIACRPGPHPVRHVTDGAGRVLMLSRRDGTLAEALVPTDGADDTAMVLDVTDVPPVAGAPSLGRAWIAGWAVALAGDDAREAAIEFAAVDPTGDLLDVSGEFVLHRLDVAEVRLERGGVTLDVDPDEYAEAEPDPLHAIEWDLLSDLADHHQPEITAFLRSQLDKAGMPYGAREPRVVRMDRYGMLVDIGAAKTVRLAYAHPVADRAELARLLHPVLCPRCAADPATSHAA
ncbi:DUF2470 domain-containing protein [Catenuloplanes atrovinosus]|uniref:DUF2470 domain-containing protein n=1 Tax=Catenuloplanes atrovinosus TaxID=137266 RepID=A0AAE4CE12_9ACTN|nr:DUF2470 domain-containing protein [Catenuloplanes atrovinosus]MDR7278115.1 hypothetical protein [Catenuloplanes atrovinosus]